jgi:hypothetical protein
MKITVKDLVENQVKACGSVSFRGIAAYVRDQYPEPVKDYIIAGALTLLIRQNKVIIGEEGTTFDVG